MRKIFFIVAILPLLMASMCCTDDDPSDTYTQFNDYGYTLTFKKIRTGRN